MESKATFSIYDASAGSGKTFTLVKAYLTILFKSKSHFQFKNILAITFTNKAVFEMKERIINTLKEFSNENVLVDGNDMFYMLCEELQMQPEALHSKSKMLLHTIIHNYAAFEISTIDGFTHRIIRTFAHDLKLPLNFEVDLDSESLLNKAVDQLIAKAGTDKEITDVLVRFAIEKADDDKSWNIALDLYKIAKLLIYENDIPYLEALKDKELSDFNTLKKQLYNDLNTLEASITEAAKHILNTFENNDLTVKDFSRGTLYNHFVNASEFKIHGLYKNQLEANIKDAKVYTKTLEASKKELIDGLLPEIESTYLKIKQAVYLFKFRKTISKNLTQLSVLNAINQELIALKEDENKMLISEFNTLISQQIASQPTPFIYERLGEKFNHYFIDEFQDTSKMQWNNLIPLVSEAIDAQDVEKDSGSLMIVGDAKQAIYRWRGGEAEQFIELSDLNSNHNPFNTPKNIQSLDTNYRSFKEVIHFNNTFFNHISGMAFSEEAYGNLYQRANQNQKNPNEGYVNISFLDLKDEDRDELYPEQVYNTIQECITNGYQLKDICILVRKTKNAVVTADYLSKQGVPIISSELLLIKQAPEVLFLTHLATVLFQPKNAEIKSEILYFLAEKFKVEDKHHFFAKHIALDNDALFKSFEQFGIFTSAKALIQLPLFDMFETMVREFNLVTYSNAYIQYYLDVVLEYTHKKDSDIFGFLEYFEAKIDKLSIVSPDGQDAVQIMTIHKSKGLEFPVVIFPFADLNIYEDIEPKEWFPLNAEEFNGFPYTLLDYNKSNFEEFGDEGLAISTKHESELELDSLNLLYVALTRPVEQLHIISSLAYDARKNINLKKYSGLFMDYLMQNQLWQDDTFNYRFGNPMRLTKPKKNDEEDKKEIQEVLEFISTAKKDHNIKIVASSGYLWDTKQQDAIEKGNLVHNLMAKIKVKQDIDVVLKEAEQSGLITAEQFTGLQERILQIIEHPELKAYFNADQTIYTERDIIKKDGTILRPDRLIINSDNEVTIIDYKTGTELDKHKMQLQLYQDSIEEMDFKVVAKILVYINEELQVRYV
ncbi:UvrD/REP family helicase [Formosa agariphila KMM 3901]|uniref:DNA 3'-5' helicase n=1 Tax=Formosa agariphila (strain DSM 15362 / KCTC 12365 / LMG 23005 / KMM 3901 / M-2Alg 35-1) TaxID=1347342 RepID=T2KH62_FORAG|nr:UvrD-helicase domain-containing protein [Formosa agariphila]CDF77741.1 UvrD/REP family helicase [Formosa agariphila KMM 3901]